MLEQRLTRRLFKYWDLIRKNKDYPDINRFNSSALEDVWPYCMQIGVSKRGRLAYKYEYMGEPIAKLYGQDLTGLIVDHHAQQFPGAVIHKKLAEVVEKHVPLLDENHFVSGDGQMIKYRACLLPFGNPKRGVTHIVVGLSCRAF